MFFVPGLISESQSASLTYYLLLLLLLLLPGSPLTSNSSEIYWKIRYCSPPCVSWLLCKSTKELSPHHACIDISVKVLKSIEKLREKRESAVSQAPLFSMRVPPCALTIIGTQHTVQCAGSFPFSLTQ